MPDNKGKKKTVAPERWIVTEHHHEPIIEPERFGKIQKRFNTEIKKRNPDGHILVGRLKCGCCGRTLRHERKGHPHYWCADKNNNGLTGCVARAEDFSLEQLLLFRLQEHIMELGESSRLLEAEKDAAGKKLEEVRTKYRETERVITENRERRMRSYERYVLEGASYDAGTDDRECLEEHLEELNMQLREAEDEVLRLEKKSAFESFVVKELTSELMDEYFKEIVVHAEDDLEIVWKK